MDGVVGGLPPLISDELGMYLIDFLKIGGAPAMLGLIALMCAWRGTWPWWRRKGQ